MAEIPELVDIAACVPRKAEFKHGNKKYEMVYNYRALRHLENIYGSVQEAIATLLDREDVYNTTLNFLYAGLTDDYDLTKQELEEWIGPLSINVLYNIVTSALMMSFGKSDGEESQGEVNGGTTGI